MKKTVSFLLAVSLLCTLWAGCGVASDEVYELKFGHTAVESENDVKYKALVEWVNILEGLAPGRFKFIMYPNAQLGSERELAQGIQLGTIEGAILSGQAFNMVDSSLADAMIDDVPFLIPSLKAYYAYIDDVYIDHVYPMVEKSGFKVFTTFALGGTDILNSRRPVRTPADAAGLKIRVWESPGPYKLCEAMGASAISTPFAEAYTSIQNGAVDGIVTSDFQLVPQNFTEVAKYHTSLAAIFCGFNFVFSTDFFNKLPPDMQEIVVKSGKLMQEKLRNGYAEELASGTYKLILDSGVASVIPTPEEWQVFNAVAREKVWPDFQTIYSPGFFDEAVKYFENWKE